MNPYSSRLHDLFQLEFFGMKLGLENISSLLEFLGRPDRKVPSIHVAGTNGKGSVSSMLAAIHTADGKKTGLFTSPHLVEFRERIRIDGEVITEAEVGEFLSRCWSKIEELKATFFEVTTAMAFDHFARHGVDIAVIETGLGGRLDATNVLERPLVAVITSIGLDHQQQLGDTLPLIATEKAGILKATVPAVVQCLPELEKVFAERATEVGATIQFVREFEAPEVFATLRPSLLGEFQESNLRTVLAACSVLPHPPSQKAVQDGIARTSILTGLRGRMEEFFAPDLESRGIRLFLDVGHNADALEEVKKFFQELHLRPITVFGIMRDKDVTAALVTLGEFVSELVAVNAETPRALSSRELFDAAQRQAICTVDAGGVMDGVSWALANATDGGVVLVSGSHYVVGEFLKNFT